MKLLPELASVPPLAITFPPLALASVPPRMVALPNETLPPSARSCALGD